MNEREKSDSPILPRKLPNKGCGALQPAEGVEGRGLAEGNSLQQTRFRTQGRADLQSALGRIRQAANILSNVCASLPKAGAQCGSSARWDLCGGRRVTGVPTAIEFAGGDSVN
jgi:hypothetical protein